MWLQDVFGNVLPEPDVVKCVCVNEIVGIGLCVSCVPVLC